MPTLTTSPSIKHVKPVALSQLEGDLIPQSHKLFGIIWINQERLSGAPCFYRTRVPIKNLFDFLEGGDSLAEFLEGFPGVSREQAVAVLKLSKVGLMSGLPNR